MCRILSRHPFSLQCFTSIWWKYSELSDWRPISIVPQSNILQFVKVSSHISLPFEQVIHYHNIYPWNVLNYVFLLWQNSQIFIATLFIHSDMISLSLKRQDSTVLLFDRTVHGCLEICLELSRLRSSNLFILSGISHKSHNPLII